MLKCDQMSAVLPCQDRREGTRTLIRVRKAKNRTLVKVRTSIRVRTLIKVQPTKSAVLI